MSMFDDSTDPTAFRVVASSHHTVVVVGDDDQAALDAARERFTKAGIGFDTLEVVGRYEDGDEFDDLADLGLPEGMVVDAAAGLYNDDDLTVDGNAVISGWNIQIWQHMVPATVLAMLAKRDVPAANARRSPDMIATAESGAVRAFLADRPASEVQALERIQQLIAAAEGVWNALPRDVQDRLHENSNAREEVSLRHCLRWGAQVSDEMWVAHSSDAEQAQGMTP